MSGERTDLASYAARSNESRGRKYEELFKDDRPAFERDRDRVIHSAAFRRLEYKTQVFINHEGDYYRTRLTHSLEVAQIARGLSRSLGLNTELAEALSLAHDLGHTPFGHTGERVLNELMLEHGKDHWGFEHNLQGLRVVTQLEKRYPGYDGINLTWEVREGIAKHSSSWDESAGQGLEEYDPGKQPTLEAQLIDLADEIAYNNHDIDDGLEAGYIRLEELMQVRLWRDTWELVYERYPSLTDTKVAVYQTISYLIGRMMKDLVTATSGALEQGNIVTLADVRSAPGRLVRRSPEMEELNRELKTFLFERLYHHPKVEAMRVKSERFLTELFDAYRKNPKLLEPAAREAAEQGSLERTICDLIAGMTDRTCQEEYRRLFDPYQKV